MGAGSPFPEAEALKRLESAWTKPEGLSPEFQTRLSDKAARKPEDVPEIRLQTVAELLSKTIAPPKWVVENMLPEGLVLMAGAPKLGKTTLTYQLALTVAEGGKRDFLGLVVPNPRPVIYLDLEQGEGMAQRKTVSIREQHLGDGGLAMSLAFDFPRIGEGFTERMAELMEQTGAGLAVVDVWTNIKPPPNALNGNAYDDGTVMLKGLRSMAKDRGVCLMLVHHTNKGKSVDPFQKVSGTNAMTAVPDTMMMLTGDRNQGTAKLDVSGREVAGKIYGLIRVDAIWQIEDGGMPF